MKCKEREMEIERKIEKYYSIESYIDNTHRICLELVRIYIVYSEGTFLRNCAMWKHSITLVLNLERFMTSYVIHSYTF